jgi:hypothetical protein
MLHLDQLTVRDMEIYVRGRLTTVEEEKGWYTDFGDQTQAAERFVQKVAHDTQGVFLWIELVVKAICSEMRKGKQLQQLDKVFSDFPTDLDDYFRRLIFDCIGRSRQNIKDTAAALKLAVNINTFENSSKSRGELDSGNESPFAKSFVNFWLLSNDHLMPRFSWQDYERIVQPCSALMMNQTASFLEETCKDLLVLNHQTEEVDFAHRTVFDFLTDKNLDVALEEEVPAHFYDKDFIFNLAKLRCICILRGALKKPKSAEHILYHILYIYQDVTHLDANASWLLTCESLTISGIQNALKDSGQHSRETDGTSGLCVKAGLSRVVLELYKQRPSHALVRDWSYLDLLGELLQATTYEEIRDPDLMLYRCVMEFGCNPNAHIDRWPCSHFSRYPFTSEERYDQFEWCARTTWQAWLGEAYLQIKQRIDAVSPGQIGNMLDMQKQWLGALVDLLLRYGADPRCTICITDHEKFPAALEEDDSNSCNHVTLEKLLQQIVPPESIGQLLKLRNLCSDGRVSHMLRRNQPKRAMRSLFISERDLSTVSPNSTTTQRYIYTKDHLRKDFLEALTGAISLTHSLCHGCSERVEAALATWCAECQGLSSLCLGCSLLRPSEVPGLDSPCNNLTVPRASRNEDHTSVVFV